MVTQEASFLRDRPYLAVSSSHFFVDILNNSRSLLVAILAVTIGLTNAQVGIALLIYNVGSALAQPFFGVFADRYGPRWFIVGGLGWMIFFYSLAIVVGDRLALLAITVAGLGSGALHPAGTKVASEVSTTSRTRATGIFFAAGQTGLFLGPLLAGALLGMFGRPGYLVLPFLALSAFFASWHWVTNGPTQSNRDGSLSVTHSRPVSSKQTFHWRTVIPLTLIVMTTSTVGISIINFAPKLFTESGYEPLYVGATAGLYMMGSAVGGIFGGAVGDRYGPKAAILTGTLAAIIPLYLYIPAGDFQRLNLLLIGGFFAGMPHSVLVIMAQSLLPGRRAFASGLTLGLMFFSGAIGTLLVGLAADQIGLATALQGLVIVLVAAAAATLLLRVPAT